MEGVRQMIEREREREREGVGAEGLRKSGRAGAKKGKGEEIMEGG